MSDAHVNEYYLHILSNDIKPHRKTEDIAHQKV